jgi:diamine N-acetyltransferase
MPAIKFTLNGYKEIEVRLLQSTDAASLFHYLQHLSHESRSRFAPHAFDMETISNVCNNINNECLCYIAIEITSGNIIAYMLFQKGMTEWDTKRFAEVNLFFNHNTTVTFAPSVADAWQSSGLGSRMHVLLEEELKSRGIQHIILWAGVQASNEKAVNFYKKFQYRYISSFWHEGKENFNMVKTLS